MTVNESAARAHAKRLARASEQRALFFRDSVAPGHADADTWLLRRSVAHSTTFSGVPASSMASQQPKTETDTAPELDAAEVERRRKQRDLKRKSRERKKRNLLELQTTAQALELEYKQLFAAKLTREQQQQHDGVTVKSEPNPTEIEQSRLIELQEKYKAVRQEMHELREQMTDFKLKLEEYERFIAMLDGHLMGFQDTQTRQEEPTS